MGDVANDPVLWLRRVQDELASDPTLDLAGLAERTDTAPDVVRDRVGRRLLGLLLPPPSTAGGEHDPAQARRMVAAVRRAAQMAPGTLTEAAYSGAAARSAHGLPTSGDIVRVFGSWNNVLIAAGLAERSPTSRRAGAWSEDAIARAVAQFVVEQMSHSHLLYQLWATGRRWVPSMATIRRTHTWMAAREAAMRILYEDDVWAEKYAEAIRVEVDRRVIDLLLAKGLPGAGSA